MLVNYAGQMVGEKFSGGGGRSPQEFNDGEYRFWDGRDMNWYVARTNDHVVVAEFEGVEASHLMRIRRLVSWASFFPIRNYKFWRSIKHRWLR